MLLAGVNSLKHDAEITILTQLSRLGPVERLLEFPR
jgi:hypothetical protein